MNKKLEEVVDKNILESLKYQESYTCRYNRNNDKLFMKKITIPSDIMNEIKKYIVNSNEKYIEEYDPEVNNNEFVLTIDASLLLHHQPIVEKILHNREFNDTNPSIKIVNEDQLPKSDDINFIIHKFTYNKSGSNLTFLAYSKHEKKSILNKIYKLFNKDEFSKIDKNDYYVFRDDIVCFLFEERYFIYDKNKFHGIFKYWDELYKVRDKILNFFEESNIVTNLDEYKATFKQYIYMQSLVKIDIEYANKLIDEHKETIKKVCEENQLYLDFNADTKQFTINDKTGVTNLNRILSKRSGYNFEEEFVTFPTYQKHQKKQLST